jgi:hypothetical protein
VSLTPLMTFFLSSLITDINTSGEGTMFVRDQLRGHDHHVTAGGIYAPSARVASRLNLQVAQSHSCTSIDNPAAAERSGSLSPAPTRSASRSRMRRESNGGGGVMGVLSAVVDD